MPEDMKTEALCQRSYWPSLTKRSLRRSFLGYRSGAEFVAQAVQNKLIKLKK